jgi:hypothetical protein
VDRGRKHAARRLNVYLLFYLPLKNFVFEVRISFHILLRVVRGDYMVPLRVNRVVLWMRLRKLTLRVTVGVAR